MNELINVVLLILYDNLKIIYINYLNYKKIK
jgi:hypothetical protein